MWFHFLIYNTFNILRLKAYFKKFFLLLTYAAYYVEIPSLTYDGFKVYIHIHVTMIAYIGSRGSNQTSNEGIFSLNF